MKLQLETIINSLEDAVVCVDETSHVVFLNAAGARLFDCEGQKVAGQPVALFPAMAEVLNQLNLKEMHLSSESPKAAQRLRGKKNAGEAATLEALVTRVTAEAKSFYIVDIRDISSQQQMEKALIQSKKNQAIGALTSGIAHDFNNILTAVISQLELALASPELPGALRENLGHARTSARRGADLVSKLQGFGRQTKAKPVPVELPGLVQQTVSLLRRDSDAGLQIASVAAEVKPWLINADANQLMQAIMNLGLAGRDALSQGGKLTLSLANVTLNATELRPRRPGDFVRLTIAATGPALMGETLRGLLEGSFGTKDAGKEVGVGLAGASGTVVEHGGWIEVETRLGYGQVHVFLPRCLEPLTMPAPRAVSALDANTLQGHERILVVDDEELVRLVIRAVLAYRGYQITEATDGEDALRKYAKGLQPYDLVLMDLHMPGLNGREALVEIRRRDPSAKAILFSGTLPEHDTTHELRDVRLLQKPFENQELVRLVRATLDDRSTSTSHKYK